MKGQMGTSATLIRRKRTKEEKKRTEQMRKVQNRRVEKCKRCHWNEEGFCKYYGRWCSNCATDDCKVFAKK